MNKVTKKDDISMEDLPDSELNDMDDWTHKAKKKNKSRKNEKNKGEKFEKELIKQAEEKY